MKIKDNRSTFVIILLSIITAGIYGLFFVYELARDTNIACAKDGKHTRGLLAYLLLSLITGGIYAIVWWIFIVERWNQYLRKNDMPIRISGLGYFLWTTLGCVIIVGPFIALYQAVHTINDVARVNNK